MKLFVLLLVLFLAGCESSKRVVNIQRTITVDTIYTFLAEDGTICTTSAVRGRGVTVGSLWNCIW